MLGPVISRWIFTIGLALGSLGFLFQVVALATTRWVFLNLNSPSLVVAGMENTTWPTRIGIFRYCLEPGYCKRYTDPEDEQRAVQGLVITGELVAGIAIIVGGAYLFLSRKSDIKATHQYLQTCTTCLSLLAAFLIILGIVVWGIHIHDDLPYQYNIGYSCAFAITAASLMILSGFVCLAARLFFD